MWFLLSLLSKSRHDSARCLSRCLPLRLGAALLTPTEPKRFHWEYSRARGYALTQVPCWTGDLDFPTYRGKQFIKFHAEEHSRAAAAAIRTFPAQTHSTSPPASQWGQCCGIFPARKINKPIPGLGYSFKFYLRLPGAVKLQQREESCCTEQHFEREEGLQWVQKMLAAVLPTPHQRNNKSSVLHVLPSKRRM